MSWGGYRLGREERIKEKAKKKSVSIRKGGTEVAALTLKLPN